MVFVDLVLIAFAVVLLFVFRTKVAAPAST